MEKQEEEMELGQLLDLANLAQVITGLSVVFVGVGNEVRTSMWRSLENPLWSSTVDHIHEEIRFTMKE